MHFSIGAAGAGRRISNVWSLSSKAAQFRAALIIAIAMQPSGGNAVPRRNSMGPPQRSAETGDGGSLSSDLDARPTGQAFGRLKPSVNARRARRIPGC
jgi:hypothetical protein